VTPSPPDISALPEPPARPENAGPGRRRPTDAATRLVQLAQEAYRLGVTPSGDVFATRKAGSPHLAMPLKGGRLGLQSDLARRYFETEGRVPNPTARSAAAGVLEGLARDLPPEPVHVRTAEHDGALYIDMGDTAGHVIRVDATGWRIQDTAPVLFQRSELTGELPRPAEGGDLAELWDYLNVSPADRPLLVAAMLAAYLPDMPHPVVTLAGEQGTGKSTAARHLVDLLDPSTVPLRKPPRDTDQLVTAMAGSWVVCLDNLSRMPDWLSDSLCRAVTGDGDVRRKLYTDGELAVYAYKRQVLLTGIDFAGLNGDLAERMLAVPLERIDSDVRRDEAELNAGWADALPRILAALFDLLVIVRRLLPGVQLAHMPRMADFARVLAAVDMVLHTDGLARYMRQAGELARDSLDGSAFMSAVLAAPGLVFEGTTAELLAHVRPSNPDWKPPRDWPVNARQATGELKRGAPALRKIGWIVDELGQNAQRLHVWKIRAPDV
jgi:hypothetical protein